MRPPAPSSYSGGSAGAVDAINRPPADAGRPRRCLPVASANPRHTLCERGAPLIAEPLVREAGRRRAFGGDPFSDLIEPAEAPTAPAPGSTALRMTNRSRTR